MHTRRNAWIDFQRRAFCPSMFMSSTEYTHLLMILLSFRELKTIPSKKTTLAFTQFIIQTLYAAHQGGISACRKSMFVYKMKRCTVQFISPRTPLVSA